MNDLIMLILGFGIGCYIGWLISNKFEIKKR